MAVKARAEMTLSSIRDIQSVTRYYLLQSSTAAKPDKPTTNPPGGDWVKAEPTYTSGSTNSLYFTDCTVFSDDTFVYSDVSLSSSYEAAKVAYNKAAGAEDVANSANEKIDNLQIGGRNLLLNSEHFIPNSGIFSESTATLYNEPALDGELPYCASGPKYVKVTFPNLTIGEQYAFSCEVARLSGVSAQPVYITINGEEAVNVGTAMPGAWVQFSTIFTATASTTYAKVQVYTAASNGYATYVGHFRHFKLERGNKATDWTPAPEDLDEAITAAQETANGKNTVYYQAEAPSGGTYKTNDIWFDTDNGNKMYMWNGSTWVAEQFGNAAISDLSITNAKIANGTIESAKISNLDAGKITSGTMSAARIKGDELKLGGDNNTDGVMKVYNADGELVGSFTKEGLEVIAGTIAGWTIEQDSLSGEQDFGEEKWHVALSPAFGLRFRDIPDGADPDSGWIREVYYNSGLARFSHVSNGNYYTGAIEACNESDGIQVVPELVVSDVDFPDSDDPVTKVTSQSVETDVVKGKGLYLHPLGTGDSFYLQQPIMIMAGQTTISNGTAQKRATICTIPTAYQSGWLIVPLVTRTYGNSGVAPADNGDFYYAYYNSADHEVDIKLANLLPSGVEFTFDYLIYAVPES